MKKWIYGLLLINIGFFACTSSAKEELASEPIRVATFNTSLYRDSLGLLLADLQSSQDSQMMAIAEIVQRVRPDVLVMQEFDYAPGHAYLKLFQKNYLAVGQNGMEAIDYPYAMAFPSNTGEMTAFDLNKDGKLGTPNDAFGYGAYVGQYAFAVLSKFPINEQGIRTFQNFLWKDMPEASLPFNPADSTSYYSPEELAVLRLSSKNHVDVPVVLATDTLHLLVSHPTPPVFDGPEDRNGKRNHDEIKFWADYISNASYFYDDKGEKGGLAPNKHFIIAGDLNADPVDGDSYQQAVNLLLQHPLVNKEAATGGRIPQSAGSLERHEEKPGKGLAFAKTAYFGLRADYVLPDAGMQVDSSGVFWPTKSGALSYLVKYKASSDHRMVWVDIKP